MQKKFVLSSRNSVCVRAFEYELGAKFVLSDMNWRADQVESLGAILVPIRGRHPPVG